MRVYSRVLVRLVRRSSHFVPTFRLKRQCWVSYFAAVFPLWVLYGFWGVLQPCGDEGAVHASTQVGRS